MTPVQLVLLSVLSCLLIGAAHDEIPQSDVERISEAVLHKLLPYMNSIEQKLRRNLTALINDKIESLNESMSNNFMEYKNQIASDVNKVLQSNTEQLCAKMETIDLNLVSINASLKEKIETQLEEHNQQTASELAKLQSNMTSQLAGLMTIDSFHSTTEQLTQLCVKMDALDSNIISVNASMGRKVAAMESQLKIYQQQTASGLNGLQELFNNSITSQRLQYSNINSELQTKLCNKMDKLDMKLVSMNDSMKRLSSNVEAHDDNVTSELIKLDHNLQQNFVHIVPPPCGTGSWRRVVYLDMKDPNTNCPSGWQLSSYSKRTCTKVSTEWYTCDSVTFPVHIGGSYTKVCGRIIGYQYWNANAFAREVISINNSYIVGVSLTHGTPRQHIWTFAAGYSEFTDTDTNVVCPCDATGDFTIPPFVGGDYFCESGWNSGEFTTFFPNDPLWDGEGCTSSSRCCSFNNPPYFTKELPRSTNDGIEVRLCHHTPFDDAPIELIELYVQ